MVIPSRRTLIVLATLVSAMTLVAALLLMLEPQPNAAMGGLSGVSLRAIDDTFSGEPALFAAIDAPQAAWDAIAIHFSGATYGSAQSVTEDHLAAGLSSLAHHLIIGNGQGAADGQIELSDRWKQQAPGLTQSLGAEGHSLPIDICLIGDGNRTAPTQAQMEQLVEVVRQLQQHFNISADRVLLYSDAQTGRGRLFPVAWFRQQLLQDSR